MSSVHGKHMIGPPLTLAETVYSLVEEEKKTKVRSKAFEQLLEYYGRDKLRALYKEERARQQGDKANDKPAE